MTDQMPLSPENEKTLRERAEKYYARDLQKSEWDSIWALVDDLREKLKKSEESDKESVAMYHRAKDRVDELKLKLADRVDKHDADGKQLMKVSGEHHLMSDALANIWMAVTTLPPGEYGKNLLAVKLKNIAEDAIVQVSTDAASSVRTILGIGKEQK